MNSLEEYLDNLLKETDLFDKFAIKRSVTIYLFTKDESKIADAENIAIKLNKEIKIQNYDIEVKIVSEIKDSFQEIEYLEVTPRNEYL